MTARRLYLDDAPGERRGVVTLDGRPERLILERFDDLPLQQPGARGIGRVRAISRTLNTAFIDLGDGPDALLPLTGEARGLAEGSMVEIEIAAAARSDKGALARFLGRNEGVVRLLAPNQSLEIRLRDWAPGAPVILGAEAREAADVAEEAALAVEHPLPGGGRLFIEAARALTAVDVDLGAAEGDGRRAVVRANQAAITEAARLLRLKGLGGVIAIDLAGKGHDGARLSVLAKAAFAPEGAGVSIGPISRFGVLELALPWRAQPVAERLLSADSQPSVATVALRLLRSIEAAAGPGMMIDAYCTAEVAKIAEALAPQLAARIGPRFHIHVQAFNLRTDVKVAPR